MFKRLGIFLIALLINFLIAFWQDSLLDKVFEESKSNQQVLDNSFSWWNTDLTSIIRNVIWLLSKFALAVWVTLFLWWGIRFLLSVWEESKMKKARDDIILVGVGLLLTLASLAILMILQTVPRWIKVNF